MERKIRIRKIDMMLNGNKLTGNTYQLKETIKKHLGGAWSKDQGAWIVDVAKVEAGIAAGWIADIEIAAPVTAKPASSSICPRCGTVCYGDCTANG